MSEGKKTNGKLLHELLVNLATITERINNHINKNNEDFTEIKETLKDIQKITGNEVKDIRDRLKVLEEKEIKLSTTWKICFFVFGAVPTIIAILKCLGYI